MDEVRFREIFEQAMEDKYPEVSYSDLPYEILEHLVEQLGQGNISDPLLEEMLIRYKAYDILFDIENGMAIYTGSKKEEQDDTDLEPPF